MGSSLSARDARAAARMTCAGVDALHGEQLAQCELVLGQGAGLVRAQHVHARELLDGYEPAHDRLLLREQARADRHRHRKHRRHRDGDRGDRQHQSELQRGENRVAAEDRDPDDHRDQSHREQDQVVPDLQHRALEVADGVCLLHQFRRLAEVRVRTGGIDQCTDLALTNDRSREHRLARLAGGRQRLAGQRGLIHLDRIALEETRVRRHDVAQPDADDVAGHQLTRRRGDPGPVASRPGH